MRGEPAQGYVQPVSGLYGYWRALRKVRNRERATGMSSRVKKDRRASGVKFTKPAKTPTPLLERHEFRTLVLIPFGLRDGGEMGPRSEKELMKVRKKWGINNG